MSPQRKAFNQNKTSRSVLSKSTSGQGLVEYVMLTLVVAGLISLMLGMMPRVLARLEEPIRQRFKYAYKYGDPKACGFEDSEPPCTGAPTRHPRYDMPDNFRMFGRGP